MRISRNFARSEWLAHCLTPLQAYCSLGMTALLFILTATGCTAMTNSNEPARAFRDQQAVASARLQIAEWVKEGSALTDASDMLEAKGFRCSSLNKNQTTPRFSLFCVYTTPAPIIAEKRVTAPATPVTWKVILESQNGSQVNNVVVSREPMDLGV